MKVGDLVRVHIGFDDVTGLVTTVHQEFNEHGFVPEPDAYALTVIASKNPYNGMPGHKVLHVFSSEVMEVISESR